VRRLGYQLLGYWTWQGMKRGFRAKYGDAPRKLLLGGLLLAVLAALVLAGRRAASE
jgi:hypothetical protein